MKTRGLIACLWGCAFAICLLAVSVFAEDRMALSWMPADPSEGVTNYCVWRATGKFDWSKIYNTTNTSILLTNQPPGVLQVRVTAQGTGGESLPSDTILFVSGPKPPKPPLVQGAPLPPTIIAAEQH